MGACIPSIFLRILEIWTHTTLASTLVSQPHIWVMNSYILVLNLRDEEAEGNALRLVEQNVEHYIVKSKTVSQAGIEITAELRTKDASTAFVNRIYEIPGVANATLVSYNGEYMS